MWRVGILIGGLLLSSLAVAQKYEIPRLRQGMLLERTLLPDRVSLATEDKTIMLPDLLYDAFLSVSSDGKTIGAVRSIPGSSTLSPRHIISTYSPDTAKVTDYTEIHGFMGGFWGVSEISPDGSKMAYITRDARTDFSGAYLSLRILDFGKGQVSVVANPRREVRAISWSPDGRHIAFDMDLPSSSGHNYPSSEIRGINIVDVNSGTVSEIGVGGTPSWSPSGEWIAYVGYVSTAREASQEWYSYAGKYYRQDLWELRLMSTVGTHSRFLTRLTDGPNLKPMWSPDSQTILLNEVHADTGTCDIYLVDVVSGKTTKTFTNVGSVDAWVAGK